MTDVTTRVTENIQGNENTNWSDDVSLSDLLMLRSGNWNKDTQRRA